MKQNHIQLVWGDAPVPELPAGWRVEREANAPALAVSPLGEEYLMGDGVLYPWRAEVKRPIPWPRVPRSPLPPEGDLDFLPA